MRCPVNSSAPQIVCFRLEKDFPDGLVEFDFSADEIAQIFIDGKMIDYGPGHGSPELWFLQHFSAAVTPGRHCLVARVLCLGKALTARNQLSVRHGFYCSLAGNWECQQLDGFTLSKPWPDWGVYPRFALTADFNHAAISGKGGNWQPVEYFDDDRNLQLSDLPSLMLDKVIPSPDEDGVVTFDDYECVWATWQFRGRGTVSIRWGETGYLTSVYNKHNLKGEKGNRTGKFRVGNFDTMEINGEITFTDLQWRAGRYAQICCTGNVEVVKMEFRRTGYPYKYRIDLNAVPEKYRNTLNIARRTLECCSHDLYMDCPHYERLMYIGDARMEALCSYILAQDSTLARRALRFFAASQQDSGAILSRYPAVIEQMIPSFVAIFIMMLHDFQIWNDDREFVKELLPAARRAAGYLLNCRQDDGLIHPPGWQFIDWQWPMRGVPFGSECGTNSIINLLTVLAIKYLAEIEDYCENHEEAEAWRVQEKELFASVYEQFFDPEKAMFADDKEHKFYSEHGQVLALLCRNMQELWNGLKTFNDFTRCGIFFSFYYLEACRIYGEKELFEERLSQWCELDAIGLKTLPEEFIFPRSDCHAWGSHIIYQYLLYSGMVKDPRHADGK